MPTEDELDNDEEFDDEDEDDVDDEDGDEDDVEEVEKDELLDGIADAMSQALDEYVEVDVKHEDNAIDLHLNDGSLWRVSVRKVSSAK